MLDKLQQKPFGEEKKPEAANGIVESVIRSFAFEQRAGMGETEDRCSALSTNELRKAVSGIVNVMKDAALLIKMNDNNKTLSAKNVVPTAPQRSISRA